MEPGHQVTRTGGGGVGEHVNDKRPVTVRLNSLKCKVQTGHYYNRYGAEDEDGNLIGRHQPASAVEPVVTRETLVLEGGHYQAVLDHSIQTEETAFQTNLVLIASGAQ